MGMVVLGDVAAPRERGRYYAYFAVTYTTAGACGPALGGFLADHLHWSAIFWLNIPLGLAALAVTSTLLRGLPRHERPHRLDVIGAVLIVAASIAFMLASIWPAAVCLDSPPILRCFAFALIVRRAVRARLLTAPEPLIPVSVLLDPVVRCAFIANAFGWGAIVGLNIFLPSYLQTVVGLTPHRCRPEPDGAHGDAQHQRRPRRPGPVPRHPLQDAAHGGARGRDRGGAGPGLAGASLDLWWFEILLVLIGAGFGPLPSLTQVAVQNTVARHQLGISLGAMNFLRNLLATILVAAFGAIVLAGVGRARSGAAALRRLEHGAAGAAPAFAWVFYADAGLHHGRADRGGPDGGTAAAGGTVACPLSPSRHRNANEHDDTATACRAPNTSPSQTRPRTAAVSGSIKIAGEKEAGRWRAHRR